MCLKLTIDIIIQSIDHTAINQLTTYMVPA